MGNGRAWGSFCWIGPELCTESEWSLIEDEIKPKPKCLIRCFPRNCKSASPCERRYPSPHAGPLQNSACRGTKRIAHAGRSTATFEGVDVSMNNVHMNQV